MICKSYVLTSPCDNNRIVAKSHVYYLVCGTLFADEFSVLGLPGKVIMQTPPSMGGLKSKKGCGIGCLTLIGIIILIAVIGGIVGYFTRDKGDIELAGSYVESGDYTNAVAEYDLYIENHPDKSEVAYNNRAVCRMEMDYLEGATADMGRALELNEEYAIGHINRAQVYELALQYEDALAELDRAIELDPNYAPAYNNRAVVYRKFGNPEQALNDFYQAIILDGDNALYYFNRSYSQYRLGRIDAAVADLKMALELDPDFPEAADALQKFKDEGLTL